MAADSQLVPVLISGKQGSGKSTTKDVLKAALTARGYRVYDYKFAGPLYRMHDAVLGVLKELGIPNIPTKDGRLLQLLGTEWGRQTHGENIWVNCAQGAFKFAEADLKENSDKERGVFLIDDLRFKNEFSAFGEAGLKFRLEADRDSRKGRTESWRETDTHQSETDLDDCLESFDEVFNTGAGGIPCDQVVTAIVEAIDDFLTLGRYDLP